MLKSLPRSIKLVFLIAVFVVSKNFCFAEEVLQLKDGQVINASRFFYYYTDSLHNLTVKDAEKLYKDGKFSKIETDKINFSFTKNAYWFRITVKNNDANNLHNWVISINHPTLDNIVFYSQGKNGNWEQKQLGDTYPFNQRLVNARNFLMPVDFKDTGNQVYILRLQSNGTLQLPAILEQYKPIISSSAHNEMLYGIFYGILFVVVIYNIFIYFPLRDKSYLVYAVNIGGTLIFYASLNGHSFQFLWANFPVWGNYALLVGLSGGICASALFAKLFLHTEKYSKILTALLYFFTFAGVAFFFCSFFVNYRIMIIVSAITVITECTTILLAGIICVRNGEKAARYFTAAWGVFLIGAILLALQLFDLLKANILISHTVEIGSALQVLLLFFALGERYRLMNVEKEEAQDNFIEVQKDINEQLDQKVQVRTNELETVMTDLKTAQTQLVQAEKMASLGTLTAGVAHEINNPINFISGGIGALKTNYNDIEEILQLAVKLDVNTDNKIAVDQIKKLRNEYSIREIMPEMNDLFSSVNNGAQRVKEIVKGLSTFSRLDENDLKLSDIESGINSTLLLLNAK
ncbi:MAG: hypothetical protein EOP00_25020, partial [Pedobacter sp.]